MMVNQVIFSSENLLSSIISFLNFQEHACLQIDRLTRSIAKKYLSVAINRVSPNLERIQFIKSVMLIHGYTANPEEKPHPIARLLSEDDLNVYEVFYYTPLPEEGMVLESGKKAKGILQTYRGNADIIITTAYIINRIAREALKINCAANVRLCQTLKCNIAETFWLQSISNWQAFSRLHPNERTELLYNVFCLEDSAEHVLDGKRINIMPSEYAVFVKTILLSGPIADNAAFTDVLTTVIHKGYLEIMALFIQGNINLPNSNPVKNCLKKKLSEPEKNILEHYLSERQCKKVINDYHRVASPLNELLKLFSMGPLTESQVNDLKAFAHEFNCLEIIHFLQNCEVRPAL